MGFETSNSSNLVPAAWAKTPTSQQSQSVTGKGMIEVPFNKGGKQTSAKGEEKYFTLSELLTVNALTKEAEPQFKAAIKAQKAASASKAIYTPEASKKDLERLDKLEKLIPLFRENQDKMDAASDAFKLLRISNDARKPSFVAVAQWEAVAQPFLNWLKWTYEKKDELHLHESFTAFLYEYYNQGMGVFVADHLELAQAEWSYLKKHLSTPPSSEELFRLASLEITVEQALKGLTEITQELQTYVLLFEKIEGKTPSQEKGVSRLKDIEQEFLESKKAYTKLATGIEEQKKRLPKEEFSQQKSKASDLSPEKRENERLEIVKKASRAEQQQGGLLSLVWQNITNLGETSAKKIYPYAKTLSRVASAAAPFFQAKEAEEGFLPDLRFQTQNPHLEAQAKSSFVDNSTEQKIADLAKSQITISPEPKIEIEGLSTLDLNQQSAVRALVPTALRVEQIGEKRGVNTHYIVTDVLGRRYFFKTFTKQEDEYFWGVGAKQTLLENFWGVGAKQALIENFASKHEAAASTLASFVTGELVPEARASSGSIISPFLDVNREKTAEIFQNEPGEYEQQEVGLYQRLSPDQRADLFINMLADLVLLNPDTHSGQFVVTEEGRLVGVDKGRAFFSIFTDQPSSLSIPQSFIKESTVYGGFLEDLKNDTEGKKALLLHPRVAEAFVALLSLSSQAERLAVKQLLAPLFSFIRQYKGSSQQVAEIESSYFRLIQGIPTFIAAQLGVDLKEIHQIPASGLEIRDLVHETKVAVFDPRVNRLTIHSPFFKGQGNKAASVFDLLKGTDGVAAVNGGFFTFGAPRWSSQWMGLKANSIATRIAGAKVGGIVGNVAGLIFGVDPEEQLAFPSATLKVEGRLLSDTSEFLPTIGWTADGQTMMIEEARVGWQADLGEGLSVPLIRVTPLSSFERKFTIYFEEKEKLYALVVENERLGEITEKNKVIDEQANGYYLKDPNPEVIRKLRALKVGDFLTTHYRCEIKEEDSQEKRLKEERFNQMDYLVAGGGILLNKGEIDPRNFKEFANPNGRTTRLGVCVLADGKLSLVASAGSLTMEEFAKFLQKEFRCEAAISLDGGGSTTLATQGFLGEAVHGNNARVSDILVVHPRTRSLSAKLNHREGQIFSVVTQGRVDELRRLLEEDPTRIHTLSSINGQTLLQAYIHRQGAQPLDEKVVDLLVSYMSEKDILNQDQFGETVLHTALRERLFSVAERLIEKSGDEVLSLMAKKGFQQTRVVELIPEEMQKKLIAERFLSLIESAKNIFKFKEDLFNADLEFFSEIIEILPPCEDLMQLFEIAAEDENFAIRKIVATRLSKMTDKFSYRVLPLLEGIVEMGDLDVCKMLVKTYPHLVEKFSGRAKDLLDNGIFLNSLLDKGAKSWDARDKQAFVHALEKLPDNKVMQQMEILVTDTDYRVNGVAASILSDIKGLPVKYTFELLAQLLLSENTYFQKLHFLVHVKNPALFSFEKITKQTLDENVLISSFEHLFKLLNQHGYCDPKIIDLFLDRFKESSNENLLPLFKVLTEAKNQEVRLFAIIGISEVRGFSVEKLLPLFEAASKDEDEAVRGFAISYLLEYNGWSADKLLPLLEMASKDNSEIVRKVAMWRLLSDKVLSAEKVLSLLEAMIKNESEDARMDFAIALSNSAELPTKDTLRVLKELIDDESILVAHEGIKSFLKIHKKNTDDDSIFTFLENELKNSDKNRDLYVSMLNTIKNSDENSDLYARILNDFLRINISKSSSSSVLPLLKKLIKDGTVDKKNWSVLEGLRKDGLIGIQDYTMLWRDWLYSTFVRNYLVRV